MNCWLKIVIANKPKLLMGLDQKLSGTVESLSYRCALTTISFCEKAGPNPSVCYFGGTFLSRYLRPSNWASQLQGRPMGMRAYGLVEYSIGGKAKRALVKRQIHLETLPVETLPGAKPSRLLCGFRLNRFNFLYSWCSRNKYRHRFRLQGA